MAKRGPITAWEAEWLIEHPTQGIDACRERAKQIVSEVSGEWDNWEERVANETGWPDSLVKATGDPFDYMLGLRDGRMIQFTEARIVQKGKWLHLKEPRISGDGDLSKIPFERGMDVRVSEIVWVCDAPFGS